MHSGNMTPSELRSLWRAERAAYKLSEVGTGVQRFVWEVLKCDDLFRNLSTILRQRCLGFREPSLRFRHRVCDPDPFWQVRVGGLAADESFGVAFPCFGQCALALLEQGLRPAVVHGFRGEHGNAGVAVLAVVPGEERPAVGDRRVLIRESVWEAGVVFERLELGFGVGIVVADLGPAQGSVDAEAGEQLSGALAGSSASLGRSAG